jgi:hypothetical protein
MRVAWDGIRLARLCDSATTICANITVIVQASNVLAADYLGLARSELS